MDLHTLLQQIKDKEERDKKFAKRIKECEDVIKIEEENIKRLQTEKVKLKNEVSRKLEEFSEGEIKHDMLIMQKNIWTDMFERTQNELKVGEEKLDALQQSVCQNRISFCDKVKEFCNKNDLLALSRGFHKQKSFPVVLPKPLMPEIKTEPDCDEYYKLEETVKSLENELEELKVEEAKIDEAKQLKIQLQAEPSCGENFLSLRKQLKDMKDELENLELQVSKVKSEIAQNERQLLNKKHSSFSEKKTSISNPQGSNCQNYESENKKTNSVQSNEKGVSDPKMVKFNDSVETREIPSSIQLKSILKPQTFRDKSPSPGLRRKIAQQRASKLDEEMKEILFEKRK